MRCYKCGAEMRQTSGRWFRDTDGKSKTVLTYHCRKCGNNQEVVNGVRIE